MHAIEHLPDLGAWDLKILGTDLSNYAVEQARAAAYPRGRLDGVPADLVRKHFSRAPDRDADLYTVAAPTRALVTIARLNLMDPWPFRGHFDVIFCRNVMIYFDTRTRRELVMRFHGLLRPLGLLAVGSAETLAGLDTPFTTVQPSVYVKS